MERGGGKIKRGADRWYPLMPTKDIASLPVQRVAADSAHLWMWVTDNFLPDGLDVMKAWGFRYVRTWVWIKGDEPCDDGDDSGLQVGLGQYGRNCHEQLLFGVRGDAMVPTPENRPRSVFHEKRLVHSAKPVKGYEVIERVSPGPRLELFARSGRDGWTALGNQTSGGDIRADLLALAQGSV
jgi:N6-adenosine-specific RNA methylase IME4